MYYCPEACAEMRYEHYFKDFVCHAKREVGLFCLAGGAGYQITTYTTTSTQIESGIGNKSKAGVILDNSNTLIMVKPKEKQ